MKKIALIGALDTKESELQFVKTEIAEPDDVQFIFRNTRGLAGFFGASSMERLPTERAITAEMQRFKALSMV